MSNAGGSARKHPLVMRLAIIAVVFVVMSLAAIVGPNWVGLYVLPVMVIVGVVYGAIILTMWVLGGWPDRFGYKCSVWSGGRRMIASPVREQSAR